MEHSNTLTFRLITRICSSVIAGSVGTNLASSGNALDSVGKVVTG